MAKKKRKVHTSLKKFIAAISLLTLLVVVVGGVMADARIITITIRATLAMVAVGVIGRITHRILQNYEEMHGG